MPEKDTVLLINSEPGPRRELAGALAEEGFSVKTAGDGEEGIRLLRNEKPSIVVLDLVLPTVDGFTVLEQAKKDPETSPIPIIALSDLETVESIERAILLGASDYFVRANYGPESSREI